MHIKSNRRLAAAERDQNVINGPEKPKEVRCKMNTQRDREKYTSSTANAKLMASAPRLLETLQGIAAMRIDENTNHAQLLALCVGIAKTEIARTLGEGVKP